MNYMVIGASLISGLAGFAIGFHLANKKLAKEYEDRYGDIQKKSDENEERLDRVNQHLHDICDKYDEVLSDRIATVGSISEEEYDEDDDILDDDDGGEYDFAPEELSESQLEEDPYQPVVITKEDFENATSDCEELHWYPVDSTLLDMYDDVVPNPYDLLGTAGMEEVEKNEPEKCLDRIFVYNPAIECYYEVFIHHNECYSE